MNKVKIFIALLILIIAALAASYFIYNPAHTEKKSDVKSNVTVVKVMNVPVGSYPIKIEVMGQVIPAREVNIKAQVQGRIIHVDDEFITGGIFKKNAQILQIDPSDYEIDISVKKAAMSQANSALSLELGQQAIARDELKIIEQSTGRKLNSSDLALRKPQLEQARANLDSAKATLKLAELNLGRTKITAPFDGIITKRNTNIGNVITTQDVIATIVDIGEYWIEAELPVHDTVWLDDNAKALIALNNNTGEREGRLLKIAGALNENNRLATVIISAAKPLEGKAPLIIGDYVHATIYGKELENTARIPVKYLRNQNTIWLAKDGKLEVKKIAIAYKDREFAYISKGLAQGDNIIISNIITPINGMNIKTQDNES